MSRFRESCRRRGFLVTTTSTSASTTFNYVLLDGGKLHVPWERTEEFHAFYAHFFDRGECDALHVVERVTQPLFPFFVDLDLTSRAGPLQASDRDFLGDLVHAHVRHRLTHTSRMVLCACDRPRRKKDAYHDGLHVHWPDLLVTRELALRVRASLVRCLRAALGEVYDWDDAVDAAVYKTGSLRMKGSTKTGGGDASNRFYWPVWIYDENGAKTRGNDGGHRFTTQQVLALCSVRTPHHEHPTSSSIEASLATEEAAATVQEKEEEKTARPADDASCTAAGTDHGSLTSSRLINCSDELERVGEMLLRRFYEYRPGGPGAQQGQSLRVRDVSVFRRSAVIHVHNCRFCLNKGGHHASSEIYFYYNGYDDTLTQRCFSHKMYGGKVCRDNGSSSSNSTSSKTTRPAPFGLAELLELKGPAAAAAAAAESSKKKKKKARKVSIL